MAFFTQETSTDKPVESNKIRKYGPASKGVGHRDGISVVIPVYNRQLLAERALRSVLAQPLEPMEIIIVDDCSQPAFTLPQELSRPFVRVVRHEANLGAGSSRTRGVRESHGDWIAFLDSDDRWLDGTLAPRLEMAKRQFAVTHDVMVAYAAGFTLERRGRLDTRIPRASADLRDFASGSWFACGSTTLLRREAFEIVGAFDPTLRRLEDLDWFLRFALLGGRLEVWRRVAALIDNDRRGESCKDVKEAISEMRTRSCGDFYRLPASLRLRFDAYIDLESAAVAAVERRYLAVIAYLIRSFWRSPRRQLHLAKFWNRHPGECVVPPAYERLYVQAMVG
jgi:glycosyltransferase involved in cell wall biosynthesis